MKDIDLNEVNGEKDETKTEIGIKYINKRDLKYCQDYEG